MPKATTADHVYVYAAVEGAPPALPATGMPEGRSPRLIALDDAIALVVSDVPATIYRAGQIEERMSDVEWMAIAASAHHAVIEAIAECGTLILPFGLFTIFSSEVTAATAMRDRLPDIGAAFDRIRGRQEWVLRIWAPDAARIEDEPAAAAPRTGTDFLAAKGAARRRAADRAQRVNAEVEAVYADLTRLAATTSRTVLDGREHLLLDASFLIAPEAIEPMKDRLSQLAGQLLRDGCRVSFTGPWPPYRFSHLDATRDA